MEQTFGRADILVHAAGIYPLAMLGDMTPAEWHRVLAVNLDAHCLGAQAIVPLMRKALNVNSRLAICHTKHVAFWRNLPRNVVECRPGRPCRCGWPTLILPYSTRPAGCRRTHTTFLRFACRWLWGFRGRTAHLRRVPDFYISHTAPEPNAGGRRTRPSVGARPETDRSIRGSPGARVERAVARTRATGWTPAGDASLPPSVTTPGLIAAFPAAQPMRSSAHPASRAIRRSARRIRRCARPWRMGARPCGRPSIFLTDRFHTIGNIHTWRYVKKGERGAPFLRHQLLRSRKL
ncbi:SDR family oxidoreductase [Cupriavidus consociatus]|uniref:SDR family oxidoreductase n=1 Tax=Cupriavidus consociatus TaxID=2821357 RepID=UPI0024DFBEBB|nr:SDR family oxidoreductase [Cupriavidus sp. LEh21]MDK2660725.1 SDR family oxidoreductase [Cupriavidus sp. LEh21]